MTEIDGACVQDEHLGGAVRQGATGSGVPVVIVCWTFLERADSQNRHEAEHAPAKDHCSGGHAWCGLRAMGTAYRMSISGVPSDRVPRVQVYR